jgi:hypothetical protein
VTIRRGAARRRGLRGRSASGRTYEGLTRVEAAAFSGASLREGLAAAAADTPESWAQRAAATFRELLDAEGLPSAGVQRGTDGAGRPGAAHWYAAATAALRARHGDDGPATPAGTACRGLLACELLAHALAAGDAPAAARQAAIATAATWSLFVQRIELDARAGAATRAGASHRGSDTMQSARHKRAVLATARRLRKAGAPRWGLAARVLRELGQDAGESACRNVNRWLDGGGIT